MYSPELITPLVSLVEKIERGEAVQPKDATEALKWFRAECELRSRGELELVLKEWENPETKEIRLYFNLLNRDGSTLFPYFRQKVWLSKEPNGLIKVLHKGSTGVSGYNQEASEKVYNELQRKGLSRNFEELRAWSKIRR